MSEKALKDAGDKVPEDVKKGIEEKIEAVNKAKEGDDKAAIDSAAQELSTEVQKIAEFMKEENKESEEGADSEAQDAEVVEEDEKGEDSKESEETKEKEDKK
jgi:molecular chaperone DnaK